MDIGTYKNDDDEKQQGVDEMLARLYEPILWRSLKCANPKVRENAAILMIDAFPLVGGLLATPYYTIH